MRMDDLARKAGIARSTLWLIEKGDGSCSLKTLLCIADVLGLSLDLNIRKSSSVTKTRASRQNTSSDKKMNHFIVLCVEQYALHLNKSSRETYKVMKMKNAFRRLSGRYNDLRGKSAAYINEYLDTIMKGCSIQSSGCAVGAERVSVQAELISKTIELMAVKRKIALHEARDFLYSSDVIDMIDKSETRLYEQTPMFVLSLFETLFMIEEDAASIR